MIALAALSACTTRFPEEVLGLRVVDARLEGVGGGGMQVIGGGWSGSGDLVATTVAGEELVVPVTLGAGSAGMLLEMSATPASTWDLDLPGPSVPASHLFGTYRGSRESLIVLVGAVGLHLENDHGVRIDDTSVGLGIGLSASWQWLHVTEQRLDPTATGDTGDSGTPFPPFPTDTGPDTGGADTASTETGGTSGPTGGTGTGAETGGTGLR